MEDWQLIEAYAQRQSESAFTALIERHAGLVHGSALRQVRDPQLAQDVTQSVFLLLARKAPGLSRNTVLAGWLFQTTRFVASHALRGEQRRRRREQEAFQMQQLNSTSETWRRLEPIIDDALDQLHRDDRNAVLLRFMEGRSLRGVASALGVTEGAAKKRVARALERLRKVLARGGISASAAAMGDALSAGAQTAVPPAVLVSLSASAATATTPAVSAMVSEVIAAWRWFRIKIAGGTCAAAALVVLLISTNVDRAPIESDAALLPEPEVVQPSTEVFATAALELQPENPPLKVLRLRAVDAVTGQGILNAPVAARVWAGGGIDDRWDLVTDVSGICEVFYPPDTGRLDAGVLADGWEARYATWPSEGLSGIPDEWTFRLERTGAVIGGIIVNPQGEPVPHAEIWFQSHQTGDSAHRERPRERFGFFLLPVARTDAQGRWGIGFVPPSHPGFTLRARHPEYAETSIISSDAQASIEAIDRDDLKQLWAGALAVTMQAAFTLTGVVVDENGLPVAGARIQQHSQSDVHTADPTGAFRVPTLPAHGEWQFTVSADGFAPMRTNAFLGPEMGTMIVTLQPGAILRLRVVDEHGNDVPDATVGLQRWGEHRNALEWRRKTDSLGRLEWNSAPRAVNLELYAHKDGFCYARDFHVQADGEEHVIQLRRALEVYGRVVDAETGFGIQDFRAIPGYGRFHHSDWRWHASETVRGTDGLFKLAFVENEPPWQVRIIAEGYEDWISNELPEGRSILTLEVALKPDVLEESVRGLVLLPDGTPAIRAHVALLALDHNVRLLPAHTFEGNSRWLTTCDERGEFRFSVNRLAHGVAAAGPGGYAHLRVRDPRQPVTLQLQPWGRVEGMVDPSAQSHPVHSLMIQDPAATMYSGGVSLHRSYTTRMDEDGRFHFDAVPPGQFSVFINSGPGMPQPHHHTPLVARPGETAYVTIAEEPGALLKGRFIPPPGKVVEWNQPLAHARLERESLRRPQGWSSEDQGTLKEVEFWTSSAGRDFANARRMIALRVNEDGSFVSVERVPAGEYHLGAFLKDAYMTRKLTVTPEMEELPHVDLGGLDLR